jgi:hypothetical protein
MNGHNVEAAFADIVTAQGLLGDTTRQYLNPDTDLKRQSRQPPFTPDLKKTQA